MKLLRYGELGKERPGVLDADGQIRDLSGHIEDISGSVLSTNSIGKLKEIKKIISEKKLNDDLEIDGGINIENCKLVKEAGANILVSGSTIFKENNGNLKKNISLLRSN